MAYSLVRRTFALFVIQHAGTKDLVYGLMCDDPRFSENALRDFIDTQTHSLCRPQHSPGRPHAQNHFQVDARVDDRARTATTFSCAIAASDWETATNTGAPLAALWQCNGTDVRLVVSNDMGSLGELPPRFQVDALCPHGLSETHKIPQVLRTKFNSVNIVIHDGTTLKAAEGTSTHNWCAKGDNTEVLDGVTLVVVPEDFWNMCMAMHTLISVFATLTVLKQQHVSQVLFLSTDPRERKPMTAIWSRMFANRLIFPSKTSPTYCVRKAIFPFPASLSPIMSFKLQSGKECPVLGLVQQYADAFLSAFNSTRDNPAHSPARKTRVVILSRADHEKTFRRIMTNIYELEDALRRHDNGTLAVEIYLPSDHSLEDQVRKISQETDIVIATHGASLAHMIGLPLCGGVIECGTNGYDMPFHNLAHALGDTRILYKRLIHGSLSWGTAQYQADIPRVLQAVDDFRKDRAKCIAEGEKQHTASGFLSRHGKRAHGTLIEAKFEEAEGNSSFFIYSYFIYTGVIIITCYLFVACIGVRPIMVAGWYLFFPVLGIYRCIVKNI